MRKAYAQRIKCVLDNLLGQLQIPFVVPDYDKDFHTICYRAAVNQGIPLEGDVNIKPYIPIGVALATTAYAHLPSSETRIYIALYTAALAAVEDVCSNDYESLKRFCQRYLQGTKHGHPILDCYDMILRELPDRFDLVVADMMLQSNMDFIAALVLKCDMQDRPMSSYAKEFPLYLRHMSGASKIYSMLAYPRGIPFVSYVEAIPASMTYVNFINDIFSFYKGELLNESENCISNIARCNRQTKLQVLRQLADKSVKAHDEVLAVLSEVPDALEAFKRFSKGYVYFHTPRYEVPELWLMCSEGPSMISFVPKLFLYGNVSANLMFAARMYVIIVVLVSVSVAWLQFVKPPIWIFPA